MLGAALTLAVVGLFLAGRRPSGWAAAAAAALVAFGAWSLASVAWGALPDVAWRDFDQALIAAAALLTGSLAAGRGRTGWLVLGVLAGLTLQAGELLYRLQAGPVPPDWFDGRKVQGPVGYANAQGALLAVGVPLALWAASRSRLPVRLAAGACAGLLAACLLLTQSRGALLALLVALLLQAVLARDVRVLALAIVTALCGAALWLPLRHVDHALVDRSTGEELAAFRHFAGWSILACVVVGLVAATPLRPAVRRVVVAAALAVALAALGSAGALKGRSAVHDVRVALKGTPADEQPQNLPPGTTRLTSLSFTGRTQVWRAAWHVFEQHPALGVGRGQFARIWVIVRTDLNSYVLQPHSIELEALSELGVPGLVGFVAFVVAAGVALARGLRRDRAVVATAAAAFAVLLLQASVDWTLSFPALVAAVLFVVGVASGAGTSRPAGRATAVAAGAALLVVLATLAGPYLSARALASSRADGGRPQRAWDLASRARWFDRWNPDVVAWQGQVAETAGHYVLAAELYEHAASLAQQPWVDEFRRARALRSAGLAAARKSACLAARAENPLEWRLQLGPCSDIPRTPVP